jgi:hypothetical protein
MLSVAQASGGLRGFALEQRAQFGDTGPAYSGDRHDGRAL